MIPCVYRYFCWGLSFVFGVFKMRGIRDRLLLLSCNLVLSNLYPVPLYSFPVGILSHFYSVTWLLVGINPFSSGSLTYNNYYYYYQIIIIPVAVIFLLLFQKNEKKNAVCPLLCPKGEMRFGECERRNNNGEASRSRRRMSSPWADFEDCQ